MRYIIFILIVILLAMNCLAGELVLKPNSFAPVKTTENGSVNKFFVKYDLPDSLENKLVTLAFLELKTDLDTLIEGKATIVVSPLTEQWTNSLSAVVKNSVSKNDTLVTYLHQAAGSEDELRFDVTIPVIEWLKKNINNNGFVVQLRKEDDFKFNAKSVGGKPSANLRIYFENIPNDRPE